MENGESQWKMLKYDYYGGWYSLFNGISPIFLSHDLDLNFQGQKFKILISRKRYELAQNAPYDVYAGWYSQIV